MCRTAYYGKYLNKYTGKHYVQNRLLWKVSQQIHRLVPCVEPPTMESISTNTQVSTMCRTAYFGKYLNKYTGKHNVQNCLLWRVSQLNTYTGNNYCVEPPSLESISTNIQVSTCRTAYLLWKVSQQNKYTGKHYVQNRLIWQVSQQIHK